MKKSGKRLGRRELKRRIRAIVLSSVMTVTMAFSNMAGLYPAVVQADTAEETAFKRYFGNSPQSGVGNDFWIPNTSIDLSNETSNLKKPNGNYHCQSTSDTTIDLAGHTMDITPGGWSFFYVNGSTLTIKDTGNGGKIIGNLYTQDNGIIEILGGTVSQVTIGRSGSKVVLNGGHIGTLEVNNGTIFEHVNGTIGTIDNHNSNYRAVNFNPGEGSGLMSARLVTGNSYDLLPCTFTPPANKVFDKWSVQGSLKNAGETITLGVNDFSTTITATWKDAPASQSQQASQPQQTPTTTSGSSSSSYSSYDDDDDDYEAPAATDTNAALVNTNGTVATPDIALPTYTGRYQPTLTNNTGENPRAGLLTASGQAVFTFKTTSGEDDSFDHFQGAQMDGVVLSPWEYNVTRGSTIITLTKEYIDSLDGGTHTLTMIFDDETVTVPFTKAGLLKSSPKMGED